MNAVKAMFCDNDRADVPSLVLLSRSDRGSGEGGDRGRAGGRGSPRTTAVSCNDRSTSNSSDLTSPFPSENVLLRKPIRVVGSAWLLGWLFIVE